MCWLRHAAPESVTDCFRFRSRHALHAKIAPVSGIGHEGNVGEAFCTRVSRATREDGDAGGLRTLRILRHHQHAVGLNMSLHHHRVLRRLSLDHWAASGYANTAYRCYCEAVLSSLTGAAGQQTDSTLLTCVGYISAGGFLVYACRELYEAGQARFRVEREIPPEDRGLESGIISELSSGPSFVEPGAASSTAPQSLAGGDNNTTGTVMD